MKLKIKGNGKIFQIITHSHAIPSRTSVATQGLSKPTHELVRREKAIPGIRRAALASIGMDMYWVDLREIFVA